MWDESNRLTLLWIVLGISARLIILSEVLNVEVRDTLRRIELIVGFFWPATALLYDMTSHSMRTLLPWSTSNFKRAHSPTRDIWPNCHIQRVIWFLPPIYFWYLLYSTHYNTVCWSDRYHLDSGLGCSRPGENDINQSTTLSSLTAYWYLYYPFLVSIGE